MMYNGQRDQHDREGSGGLMMAHMPSHPNGDFFHWPTVFPVSSQQPALPLSASQRPLPSAPHGTTRPLVASQKAFKSLIRDTSFPSLASTKCVDSAEVNVAGPSTAQRPHRVASSSAKSSRRHKRINHSSSFFVSPSSSNSRFSLGSEETPEFYDVARLPPTEIHGHPSFIPTDAAKVAEKEASKSKQKAGRLRRKSSSSSREGDRIEVEAALEPLSIRGNAIGIPTFAGPPTADLHRKKQPQRVHPHADYTQLTINGHAARHPPQEAEPWNAQSEATRPGETHRVAHWQRPTSKRKSRSISHSKTAANDEATPTASTLLLTDSGRRVLREQSCPPSPRYCKRRSIGDAIWAGTIPGFTEESWQSSDGLQGHGEMCIYPDEEDVEEELEPPTEAPLVLRPAPLNLHRPAAGSAESSFNLTGSVPDGLQASLEGLHITAPVAQEDKGGEASLPWSPNAMNRLKVVKSKTTLVDDHTRVPHYAQLPDVSRSTVPSLAKKSVVPPTIAHRTPAVGSESEAPRVDISARTWAQVAKKPQSLTKSEQHFTTATDMAANEKGDTVPRSGTLQQNQEEAEWVEIRRTKGRVKLPTHYPSFQTSQ